MISKKEKKRPSGRLKASFCSKSHQILHQLLSPIPLRGGGLFSFLVQKLASEKLKTGYFAYSSGQWKSYTPPGYATAPFHSPSEVSFQDEKHEWTPRRSPRFRDEHLFFGLHSRICEQEPKYFFWPPPPLSSHATLAPGLNRGAPKSFMWGKISPSMVPCSYSGPRIPKWKKNSSFAKQWILQGKKMKIKKVFLHHKEAVLNSTSNFFQFFKFSLIVRFKLKFFNF